MKKALLLIFLFTACTLNPWAKNDNEFFARAVLNEKNEIVAGDSALINVWIYSVVPFDQVNCATNKVKVHGCTVRQVAGAGKHRVTQKRFNGRVYYAMLWSQFVVAPESKGSFTFPEMDFSATTYWEVQQREVDPFDPFGFFRRPKYKKEKREATSPSLKFQGVGAPMKSTQELIQSGHNVI